MPEQHGIGCEPDGLGDEALHRHRTEFAVDEANLVAVVDQWTSHGKQSERRQMIVGDTAADRWMRDVDQENAHGGRSRVSEIPSGLGSRIRGGNRSDAVPERSFMELVGKA